MAFPISFNHMTVRGLPVAFLQRLPKYNEVTLEASGSSFFSIHYYTQRSSMIFMPLEKSRSQDRCSLFHIAVGRGQTIWSGYHWWAFVVLRVIELSQAIHLLFSFPWSQIIFLFFCMQYQYFLIFLSYCFVVVECNNGVKSTSFFISV